MLESVLQRLVGIALAVLVMNALWAGILPSRSGQAVAALGVLIASVVIVTVWTSPRIRSIVAANPPGFLSRPIRAFAIVAPFLLPALVLRTAPVFAFWRFDGRSALLLAWLLSIVLAIDTSLSTRRDLPLELQSARRFAHAILRPVDALSVYSFSEVVSEVVPFTSDVKQIDRGVDRIRLGAATALYDALYLGSQALDGRQGRKVMVVITDGGDTVSKTDYHQAVRAAQEMVESLP